MMAASEAPLQAAPPQRLGRYEIIGKLGQGAMGVVYKARDPLIERVVALKTVNLAGLSREEADSFEQRFYREAKSAGRLNHANIVTIHDVGQSDGLAYIAMEFLEGRSLRELLDTGVVLPADKVAAIATRIAKGLAFAHRNGVVHRDIKPANIMVLGGGTVKIMDFGVAQLPTGSLTLAGTAFGSPKYMSPEQVVGRPVDGRSDIFSLGAVLYEMLTGVAPFKGDDLNVILYKVINEMPPPPSQRNRQVPEIFDAIVAKAMAKHPDDRYQTAQALAEDLRAYRHLTPSARAEPGAARTLERRATPRLPKAQTGKGAASAVAQAQQAANVEPARRRAASQGPRRALALGALAACVLALGVWALWRAPGAKLPATTQQAAPVPVASAPEQPAPPAPAAAAPQRPAPPAPGADANVAKATPKPAAGRVVFAVKPWGEVYVDGAARGVTPPLKALGLAAGTHEITIRNGGFAEFKQSVQVAPGAAVSIKHEFQ